MHTGMILFLQVLPWVSLLVGSAEPNQPQNQSINDVNAPALRMLVRDSYLPGIPVLVRVEITGPNGVINRDIWDANAVLSVSGNPNVKLSPNQVVLYNGLGSALVTFTGSGDFSLTANANGLEKTTTLVDWTGQPTRVASGILRQSQTWKSVCRITDDFTIPAGTTLTLEPGTLVLIEGVSSGSDGTDIDVQGSIQSLGTATSPVTFTAAASGRNWGEFHFAGAQPSLFRYTEIMRAGRSPGAGHTGTGPALRTSKSSLTFDHASLTDNAGKIMQSDAGTELTFTATLFSRSTMGPEITGTSLVFENGWIIDMRNKDDADGIYIHDQGANRACTLTGSVIAGTDDDGIDTLGSDIVVQDCIVRGCRDKAVSVYAGETTLLHCLLVGNNLAPEDPTIAAIATKTFENGTAVVNLDHVTVVATRAPGHVDAGIQSHNKYGVKRGTVVYNVTNSIVDATEPVSTQAPYLKSDIHIGYSDIVGMTWSGTGNLTADPLFFDAPHNNYRLRDTSPCLGKASPDSPMRDVGYYQSAPK